MDALKLTFVNGETVEFPFSKGSTVAVETPDGVNGSQRGVWGEVVGVEYVNDPAVEQPAAPAEPAEPAAEPVEPAAEVATPDPQQADSSASGDTVSSEPATSDAPSNTDGSTISDTQPTPSNDPAATPEA
jgi:hypothetical protein